MTATSALPQIPRLRLDSMVPTLNGTGFEFQVRDSYADEWIAEAGRSQLPALEIGCAYGVAVMPALEAGASVVACDMEPGHLQILESQAPAALRARLRCVTGQLPEVQFEPGEFGAILCSRVLHFLSGEQIDASLAAMAHWLAPGGHLYLVADTPYGIWRNFIPEFERGKREGLRWPGMMSGVQRYLPTPRLKRYIDRPAFMNLLDPQLLTRMCEEAGLRVQRATFIARSDFRGLGALDGRENAGVVALKPH
jgi:SAM-dependent methyltransferase